MKKILLLFAITLSVVACQEEEAQLSQVINVQIKASEWQSYVDSARSSRYYYYDSSVPELSSSIYNDGSVTAFVEDETTEQALPYTLKSETSGTTWSRATTYTYSEGKIMFYVMYPSLNSSPPEISNFRVVLKN